jgi:hypothetical protein
MICVRRCGGLYLNKKVMRTILTEMELRDIVYHFTVKSNA